MTLFYRDFIESILFSIVCWYGNITIRDRNALTTIVNMASKIAGVRFDSLTEYFNKQIFNKAIQIHQDPTHPLYSEYVLLPSGLRFRTPIAFKQRYKNSFVPFSVQVLNAPPCPPPLLMRYLPYLLTFLP